MWFRTFVAIWSFGSLACLGWMATHRSSDPAIFGRYSLHYFALLALLAAFALITLLLQVPFLYARVRKKRHEIVLSISTIIISLIIIELMLRVFDPFGLSYFREASRYHLDKIPDPELVFRHEPGLRRTYQGVTVSINELGLRDRSLGKKQEGELRILLLGDSVTFGWGVPIEATFGRKLEELLKSSLGSAVRTVNAGVGGYNTVQEQALLKAYADVIDPDIVVLTYVANDIELNEPPFDPWKERRLHGKGPPEVITLVLQKSWIYRLFVFTLKYSSPNHSSALDKTAPGVKRSLEALSDIAASCQQRHIRFVLFFYRESSSPDPVLDELLSEIVRIEKDYHFRVCDLGGQWGNVDIRSVINSRVDSHPNARGHEILAKRMADVLMARD